MHQKETHRFYRVTLLCIFLSVLPPAFASSGNCDATSIISNIEREVQKIRDYSLRTEVSLDENTVTSDIAGIHSEFLRIDMRIPQSSGLTLKLTSVYDGTYQWVESVYPSTTQVAKVELSKIVDKERPFDTSYYLMGSGLLNGEDYPSSIITLLSLYDFTAKCSEDQVMLSGSVSIDSLINYTKSKKFIAHPEEHIKKFTNYFHQGRLVFDLATLTLLEYQLGTKETPKFHSARFFDVTINSGLKQKGFFYSPPEGAQVEDITSQLLEQLNYGK